MNCHDMIAYICTCHRKGKYLWLGMAQNHPFVGEQTELMPILFGSEEAALDALMTYTSFKGWNIEEVRITSERKMSI